MMAESLPFCGTSTMSGWELEAWYEDLQDILCADSGVGVLQPVTSNEQELVSLETLDNSPYIWTLDSFDAPLPVDFTSDNALALEDVVEQLPPGVLEFINSDSHSCNVPSGSSETEDAQHGTALEQDSCCSSSPAYTHTDEESCASPSGSKRKRTGKPQGGKVRVKEREQENEKKVAHLVSENERLKGEIERLTMEVEKTRKDLIERMVNLKKV